MIDLATALFFSKAPQAMTLYEAFLAQINDAFDGVTIKVQKTQIAFANRYQFAFVSLPRGKVKGKPDAALIVTFGLEREVVDPRIWVATQPYPGRWTHHVALSRVDEIDAQLMDWVKQAYFFSLHK